MATRFYLQASGAVPISPSFDASWEQTGQAVRLPMTRKTTLSAPTDLTTSVAITVPATTVQQILAYQFISTEVFLPARLHASMTASIVLKAMESATAANAHLAFILRALSADGGTVFGTLWSLLASSTEFTTATLATRISGPTAVTAVTASSTFRLVLEVGVHAQGPGSAQTANFRVGSSATSDFALTAALTTDLNPWMELSDNLNVTQLSNYHSVRVGNGMSTSGAAR